jgi:UDP-N-acetylglucosamine 2-epimerase (hydrolysing)
VQKKIVFLTSSRADYGKLKPILQAIEVDNMFELHLFVTGMHNIQKFGNTARYIIEDGYSNIEIFKNDAGSMNQSFANTVFGFHQYVTKLCPDMIVIHGDRVEALAGAVVGSFNNIKMLHVEGGEISGSIDESIRHAVTKLSHYHFVSNDDAKRRVIQLGEKERYVFNIGSPDIDVMLSDKLPFLGEVLKKYDIRFPDYSIFLYHPVTTDGKEAIGHKIKEVMRALIQSNKNYIIIYPNNDFGSDTIIQTYKQFCGTPKLKFFESIQFEDFLTLLRYCNCIIGNSSAGVREASVYGVPAIDIGQRQQGRYTSVQKNILHVSENQQEILHAIQTASKMERERCYYFGDGQSTLRFMNLLKSDLIWKQTYTKIFVDFQTSFKEREAYV